MLCSRDSVADRPFIAASMAQGPTPAYAPGEGW